MGSGRWRRARRGAGEGRALLGGVICARGWRTRCARARCLNITCSAGTGGRSWACRGALTLEDVQACPGYDAAYGPRLVVKPSTNSRIRGLCNCPCRRDTQLCPVAAIAHSSRFPPFQQTEHSESVENLDGGGQPTGALRDAEGDLNPSELCWTSAGSTL
jgi:hypothetical protein